MRFTLQAGGMPDLPAVSSALAALDPAALCDLDPEGDTIRIETSATHRELLECLHGAGVAASTGNLFQLPSECCGGCGG